MLRSSIQHFQRPISDPTTTWIQELLPVDKIHYPEQVYTPEEIMEIHGEKDSPNEGLLIVSDGSVKVNNMAHGWVIANHDGKKIVCRAGAVQGKGSSLRAEGYAQEKKTRSTVLNPRRAKEFVVPSTLRRCIAS